MSLFSDRRYSISIDGDPLFIDGGDTNQLRVVFQISVSFDNIFAHADIAIYNLSADTVNQFFNPEAVISLSAGYVDNLDVIFAGGIKNVLREREGPSTITRILATSGATNRVSINHTMPTGSTIPQVVRKLGDQMGLPVVMDDGDFDGDTIYQRKSLQGDAYQELNALEVAHNFVTVIENGKIVVLKEGKSRQGSRFVISQETGMEGIPEISEIGADVAIRINPKIVMGSEIDIQSELKTFNFGNMQFRNIEPSAGSGIYTIRKMDHSGDSWGDAWTTKITGFRLSA